VQYRWEWKWLKIPFDWCGEQIALDEAKTRITKMLIQNCFYGEDKMAPELAANYRASLEELQDERNEAVARQWRSMKEQMRPEDELGSFSDPLEDWTQRAGLSGVALVSDAKVLTYVALAWS
jgi:hypothetical protein